MSGADVAGAHFGYNIPGAIGDTLWSDNNGNGTRDPGEVGIDGAVVYLYRDANANSTLETGTDVLISTQVTDSYGNYLFQGIAQPGTYFVSVDGTQALLTGYTLTTPDSQAAAGAQRTAVLSSTAATHLAADFGYQKTSLPEVSGNVWNDTNENALITTGEPMIAGVTVELLDPNGGLVATTTTDAGGNYVFHDVVAGSYTVHVTDDGGVLKGYTLTSSLDAIAVSVGATNVGDVDFGYARKQGTGSIGSIVWLDANADGQFQPNESGLAGVTVELKDGAGSPIDSDPNVGGVQPTRAVTDANGNYQFAGLPAGTYTVDVLSGVPTGLQTTVGTSDPTAPIVLALGQTYGGANFGYRPDTDTVALGDRVWYDADGDGVQDANETGIAGVTVNISKTDADGNVQAEYTVTTAADGSWVRTGLAAGSKYVVTVDTDTLPPSLGLGTTPTNLGGNDTYITALTTAGQVLTTLDFGFTSGVVTAGSIGDTVYFDANGNGIQDAGEAGIAGVTLNLIGAGVNGTVGDSDDVLLDTKATNLAGQYAFTGLSAGNYRVVVTDQSQVVRSLSLTASAPSSININCPVACAIANADFGYAPTVGATGTIGGTLWRDTQQPGGILGTLQAGEPGVQGVQVELWLDVNGDGTIQPGSDNLVRTALTDTNGNYLFLGIPAGNYVVRVPDDVTQNVHGLTGAAANPVIAGMAQVQGPSPTADSNGHFDPYALTLVAGATNTSVDFAYRASTPFSISGSVFEDAGTSLGAFNPPPGDDVPAPGAVATLYRVVSGVQYLFGSATTDASGAYSFADLPADGTYVVKVDVTGTLAEGMQQTVDPSESGVCSICDSQYTSAPLVGNLANIDFGYWNGGIVTTPVTLAYFKATPGRNKGSVDFEWWTATEVGNLGFELYVEAGKKRLRINAQPDPRPDHQHRAGALRVHRRRRRGRQVLDRRCQHRGRQAHCARTVPARRGVRTPAQNPGYRLGVGEEGNARQESLPRPEGTAGFRRRGGARGGHDGQRQCRGSRRQARASGCGPGADDLCGARARLSGDLRGTGRSRHGFHQRAARPSGALQPRPAGADPRGRRGLRRHAEPVRARQLPRVHRRGRDQPLHRRESVPARHRDPFAAPAWRWTGALCRRPLRRRPGTWSG